MKGFVRLAIGLLTLGTLGALAQDPPVTLEKGKGASTVLQEQTTQLLGQQSGEEPIIEIQAQEKTIEEIVAMLREKSGLSIDLDPTGVDPTYRLKSFIYGPLPFSKVLDAFIGRDDVGLYVVSEGPGYLRLAKPHRVTYNFPMADVRQVISVIAMDAGASVIISPKVKGELPIIVKDVPWMEVLDGIAKTMNLAIVKEKYNLMRIVQADDLLTQLEVRSFNLKFLSPPPPLSANVTDKKYLNGKLLKQPTSYKDWVDEFPALNVIKAVMTPRPGSKASTTGDVELVGSLYYDYLNNMLVVRDTKPVLDRVAEIIGKLDVEPEQVIIQARFVRTTNEDLFQFGISWSSSVGNGLAVSSSAFRPGSAVLGATGITAAPAQSLGTRPFNVSTGVQRPANWLTTYDMSLIMRIFRQDTYSRFLQEPTIAAVDNTPATIFVGEVISYAEATTTTGSLGTTPITSVSEASKSPVEIGFQLFVIPKIVRAENKIILTIIPQFQRLVGTGSLLVNGFESFTVAGQTIDLPRVEQSTIVTRLIMESGATAVLGGLIEEQATLTDRKIPILGDIPVMGWLFKSTDQSQRRSHLLIFVTPRIVQPGQVARENLRLAFQGRQAVSADFYRGIQGPDSLDEWKKKTEEKRSKELEELERMRKARP